MGCVTIPMDIDGVFDDSFSHAIRKANINKDILAVAEHHLHKDEIGLDTGAGGNIETDEIFGIQGINTTEDTLICDQIGQSILERPINKQQIFMVDILFMEKIPFWISITEPINMILVSKIKNRSAQSIFQQVMKQLATYKSRIRCDTESGLIGLQPLIGNENYEMDITGQEEAVPPVGREQSELLKDRTRYGRNVFTGK
eukprot:gene6942-14094_t